MRIVFLLIIIGWSARVCLAQDPHDTMAWGVATLSWQPDSSRWVVEGSYQYVANQQMRRYYLQFGWLYGHYDLTKQGLRASIGYISGDVDGIGRSQLPQLRLRQTMKVHPWQPYAQLTIDRLAFRQADTSLPVITRVRMLIGIEPRLSRRLTLLGNVEPFLLRGQQIFREVRSQVGVRWQPTRLIRLETLYFQRWNGYRNPRAVWEHIAYAAVLYQF